MRQTDHGWQYWIRLLLATIFALLVALAGVLIWVSYQQTMDYLHPVRHTASGALLRANGIEFQEVQLITEDRVKLSAWYTPPNATRGAVILVAHGYGDKRVEDIYALFVSHGYGVIAWDFRAHGASEGKFSSLGYYEILDAKAALDFALAQPGVEHVGAWGGSMGAVTMIRAAAQYPEIESLVADSPYATLDDEMDLRVPFPIMRSLIRFFAERETGINLDLVRPVDDIARISPRPIFLIQGLGDGMVSLDSAQRLYDAAREPRQLWVENDVPYLNMYAYYKTRYTKRVIKFFDQYLLVNGE
ncbi:MAG TPA: alpha/beta hydrolase, partial [Anaerolineales bacterium]|nr:alpha/beta hydrolase [Anaerolineales bacterium]